LSAQPWPKDDQWLAATSERAVTVVRIQGRAITQVRTSVLGDSGQEAIERVIVREALRAGDSSTDGAPTWRSLEATGWSGAKGIDALDFAVGDRPWAVPSRRRLWLAAVSASMALVACGAALHQWLDAIHEHEAVQSRLASSVQRNTKAAHKVTAPPVALTAAQIEAINGAVSRLNTPWPAIFHGLEAAASPDIVLVSVEPDARQARVRGTALTDNESAMFEYADRLRQTPPFVDARLLRHEAAEQGAGRALKFQFEAALASSGERKDQRL
jgi:hypothetical protein